jgi:hypothetical protein
MDIEEDRYISWLPNAFVIFACYYLAIQALVGVLAVEFAFSRTSRFRTKDEARDVGFPHFRRYDAILWARWKFYPGAMFTFMSRLILISLCGTMLTILVSLVSCGHDYRKGPIG